MKENNKDLKIIALQLKSLLGTMANTDPDETQSIDLKYTAQLAESLADTLYCAIVE
ncbi:MAG: hypothetical protein LKG26_07380 [Saccharofermentans sp.]|jgi:hypothetical protein|nr:hypothetical protein [Mageeibacillus sp.]MCI1275884.1 hypothetical protein [Saccharofermentans sp.]